MNAIPRHMTSSKLEELLELPAGSFDSIGWLVIQEMSQGVKAEHIAKELGVTLEELNGLAAAITKDPLGLESECWKNGLTTLKAVAIMNEQTIGLDWDAIESMAITRLANFMSRSADLIPIKDAMEIAQIANKAVRRHRGEGQGGRTSVTVMNRQRGGEEQEMEMEIRSGNLGSIRLSLSSRVRAQLEQPRIIEQERKPDRAMLSLEETRKLIPGGT